MVGLRRTLLLVSLLLVLERAAAAAAAAAAGRHRSRSMPGSPYNISKNDPGLRQAALAAAAAFNNQSNDAFLFKPSGIQEAQRQIVKGIRYIMEVQISRTVCHKRGNNTDLSKCDFQPDGLLHQTFSCHFEVWSMPWLHVMKSFKLSCSSEQNKTQEIKTTC
ncbi:cystatin [Centroberyx affinis]|uniref:cystatin n=1 Tax=Centroberyx affinis TaxID=166261 RepID=UPI003A5C57BE